MALTIYVHIHGTTALFRPGASIARTLNHYFMSGTTSAGTNHELIPLDRAPHQIFDMFSGLLNGLVAEDKCFYFQWSGILSTSAWSEAADYLAQQITEWATSTEALQVLISAHSHGGTIARLVAERLQHHEHIKFHMITLAMPLSITPLSIMPPNTASWLHIYHRADFVQSLASTLMQCQNACYQPRSIDDLFVLAPELRHTEAPHYWQSHCVRNVTCDPHNTLLQLSNLPELAQFIRERMTPITSQANPRILVNQSEVARLN